MRYFKVKVADETMMMQIPSISDPKEIVRILFGEEATLEEVSQQTYDAFEPEIEADVALKEAERNEEP